MGKTINLAKPLVEVKKTKPSLSHLEMVSAYNAGVNIYGFIGGVLVSASDASKNVPEEWTNSVVVVSNQDSTIEVPKIFLDYTTVTWSKDRTQCLLKLGYHDNYGNRQNPLSCEEFKQWADYWGIDNILTKSEYQVKVSEFVELQE